jgi:hypothetical protein
MTAMAREDLKVERERRTKWAKAITNAATFTAALES